MTGPADRALLGIDLGGTKVAVALADPDGRIRERRTIPTEASAGAEGVLRRTSAAVLDLVHVQRCTVSSAAAVTPGVPTANRIALAPNIEGWEHVDLARQLRHRLAEVLAPGAPVVVHNDVKAGALHEATAGALSGSRVGFYVNLGTGLSSAVVLDGTVVQGARGAAGEIAYQLVSPADLDDARPSDRAPLEDLVGGRALDAVATDAAGTPVRAGDAFDSTNPAVRASVEPALRALEAAVVNACCLLDPDTVVLAGGLLAHPAPLLTRLQAAVDAAAPFRAEVRVARDPFDAPLLGALLLARRADPVVHHLGETA